jgi:hypothetical protein
MFHTNDMTAQFSSLSPEVFTMGLFAIQHACARMEKTHPFLVSLIVKGVGVLYTHYFDVVLGMEEHRIVDALKRHGLPPEVEIVPVDDAFEEGETSEYYTAIFETRNPGASCPPEMIIKVPWTQTLSLVGSRKVIFIDNGIAFLDYTMVGEWMRERWKKGLQEWKEWDSLNIIEPIVAQARQQLEIDVPRNGWENGDSRYYKLVGQTENDKIHTPLMERMTKDFFTPYAQEDIDTADPSLHALVSIYRNIFKALFALEQKRASKSRRHGPVEEDDATFVPEVVDDGQIQFVGYEKTMPPCIEKIYKTALAARTHLKYAERLKFFQWAYKSKVPLEVLLEAWGAMIDNDSAVSAQFRATLINIPAEIYRREQKNEADDTVFQFAGCGKMVAYCPFGDIEDLVDRKNACIFACTEMPPSMAMTINRRWSPMNATMYLKS